MNQAKPPLNNKKKTYNIIILAFGCKGDDPMQSRYTTASAAAM